MHLIMSFPWAIFLILLPIIGAIFSFLLPKQNNTIGVITISLVLLSLIFFTWTIVLNGVYYHAIGGWSAPLGIDLYADGLSLLMLFLTALVGLGISLYARKYFSSQQLSRFWPLWLFIIAALNALFLSADIFNYYVTLELMSLAAVSLTALGKTKEAFTAAMRYLLTSLLASLLYLFGVVLLYHGFGTVDIAMLSQHVQPTPILWAGLALITIGLLLKTALFPLHFWLPPAHSTAPAPISALLSALLIKASLYILVRLWLEIFGPLSGGVVENIFGILGAVAILWGSFQALMQDRLKLLIAYSTVAQVGYIFLAFSLTMVGANSASNALIYFILSHALAKASLFLVAGNLIYYTGHDRISQLKDVAHTLPLTITAFALAGISIIGLPPSGGFVAKWFLLESTLEQEQWTYLVIVLLGGLLSAGYIFKVLGYAFIHSEISNYSKKPPVSMEWIALLLALSAIFIGFVSSWILPIIAIGEPFGLTGVKP
jgi:formate hydrogenlyase subunit 3/multisubunit Na+/H+ antiporter MnhD subunit